MIRISIIIPVFNEEKNIGALLQYLPNNLSFNFSVEIIIVDGGSNDETVTIITKHLSILKTGNGKRKLCDLANFNIKLITSPKGRAIQMNFGSKHAKGEILYFIHADCFPPKYFDKLIAAEVDKGNLAGCFRMQFDCSHWWLRLASWFTKFHWRACRGGDQSLFIVRSLFNAIGGYDENYTIYEDHILINALYKRKQFVVINKKLITSARLYQKVGVWKLQYHFWVIYFKRWFGASADNIYNYYKQHILASKI